MKKNENIINERQRKEIIRLFLPEKKKPNLRFLYRNKFETATLFFSLLFLIATCFIAITRIGIQYIYITASLTAILFPIYLLASIIIGLKGLVNPMRSLLEELSEQMRLEYDITIKLTSYSHENLDYVQQRLSFHKEIMSSRLKFLLGAIDKLGIFPAILAFYLTVAKVVEDQAIPNSWIVYISAFFLGLYIGAFFIKSAIDVLDKICYIINNAKSKIEADKPPCPEKKDELDSKKSKFSFW